MPPSTPIFAINLLNYQASTAVKQWPGWGREVAVLSTWIDFGCWLWGTDTLVDIPIDQSSAFCTSAVVPRSAATSAQLLPLPHLHVPHDVPLLLQCPRTHWSRRPRFMDKTKGRACGARTTKVSIRMQIIQIISRSPSSPFSCRAKIEKLCFLNTLTSTRITGFAQLSRIFNFYLAGLLHRP